MLGDSVDEQIKRCLQTLKAHVRRHPLKARDIERRLGYSRSYLQRIFRGEVGLPFEGLLRLLQVAGLSLDEFALKAVRIDAEGLLEKALPPDSVESPSIVEIRRVSSQLGAQEPESAVQDSACQSLFRAVAAADEQRYSDPWLAAEKASSIAIHVAPGVAGRAALELFSRATRVYGSCCRIGGAAQESIRTLIATSHVARVCGPDHRADWLVRAAAALNSHGEQESGMELAIEAGQIFERLGDLQSMGSCEITKAHSLLLMSDMERAETALRVALSLLRSVNQGRQLCAAHHGLAKILLRRNEYREAQEHLEHAGSMIARDDLYSRGMLTWTMAEIQTHKGLEDEAKRSLTAAAEQLFQINPFDAAFVVLDQIELCLASDQIDEALAVTDQLIALVEPLRSNPVAGRLILRLRNAAQAGLLSRRVVEHARQRIAGRRRYGIRPPAT